MTQEQFSRYSFLLDRTARRVKQYAQRKFKIEDFDLTVDQWLILKNLSDNARMSQSELAQILFKDQPTLTRIIDILTKKGYLERIPHPNDRRSFQLVLTQAGIDKVAELKPRVANIRQKAWENLDEQDFEEFKRILNKIYDNLE